MNALNRLATLSVLLPLTACSAAHFDRRIAPPADTPWVTLSVRVPQDVETLPMDVLYRSQTCKEVDYDGATESHTTLTPAHSAHDVSLVQQGSSNVYQAKIALDGGNACHWSLSVIRMRMQFKPDSRLAVGKKSISSSISFVFDELGKDSTILAGSPKDVYGDQTIKTTYFPRVFIGHIANETSLELFAGDTDYSEWTQTFRIHDAKIITIEPMLKSDKVVTIEGPKVRGDSVTVTYPDGSVAYSDDIDYNRLLSIK